MGYDYSKLLGLIVEKYGTQLKFSEAIGLSERSVSLKLNGRVGWKQAEIAKACALLGIPGKSVATYFFTQNVQQY